MEKTREIEAQVANGPIKASRFSKAILLLLPFTFLYQMWQFGAQSFTEPSVRPSAGFDWNTAVSKPYLEYADCYNGLQCARLELPMDYFNGTTNATISLAVAKKPAVVPVTGRQYGGAILLNPGGPGGSGVYFVLGAGEGIRAVVDSSEGKYFDLISFDPRGVGLSEPRSECFASPYLDENWALRLREEGLLESSDAALGRLWSMTTAYGKSCSLPVANGSANIKEFMSTASVARDMLSIVEAHGAWREQEAARLLNPKRTRHGAAQTAKGWTPVPESLQHQAGQEKIQYWGFSYGSYLGMTFSAMFPERIHRLVVDGVVDAFDYTSALWFDNLVDTESGVDLFNFHCARVGYPRCALAKTENTTQEDIKARVQNITTSLLHNPLPVIGPNPDVITYSDVKDLIFGALYSPMRMFPIVSDLLSRIQSGDGQSVSTLLRPIHELAGAPLYNGLTSSDLDTFQSSRGVTGLNGDDATMAIACSDGDIQSHLSKDGFVKHWQDLVAMSPTSGSIWAMARLRCIHYGVRAKTRYPGPWESKTSHPVLFLGNSADPVTPGRYAIKMAKGYVGAVALIQDSPGHCTINAVSGCTVRYVRKYFQTGELPPANTTCKIDQLPFGPTLGEAENLDAEVLEMRERLAEVGAALEMSGGGLMRGSRQPRVAWSN